VGVKAL